MKKLYRFSAIALLVLPLVFTSCSDYLDRDDDDNITEADVFARYEKVNGLVSDVYAAAKKADRPAGVLRALQQQCHYGRM